MRFSATAISALTLLTTASARITGLQAPATIAAGKNFTVTLLTSNYIQSVYDVAAAFGLASTTNTFPDSLGNVFASEYIGPAKSNIITPIDFTAQIAEGTAKGKYLLQAETLSLYGVGYSAVLTPFNVTVTIGDETGKETVSSSL